MAVPDTESARLRNPRGEGDRLREQLLDAAATLLDAEGDAARVSVRAVARAAGVSPTAVYLHFADRDSLVSAAVDRGFAAFNGALRAAADPHDGPLARLRASGVAYLEFAERQPALYAVLFSTRRPAGRPVTDATEEVPAELDRDEALSALVAAVAALRPDDDPGAVRARALTLWAALHGFASLRDRPPVREWPTAAAYVDLLLAAHLGRTA